MTKPDVHRGADAELARAARGGSTAALAELYRGYADLVFGVACHFVGAPDAEDVLQDVFVALPEALKRFDPARPLEPWLRRLAARASLSRLRSDRRRLERDSRSGLRRAALSGDLDRLAVHDALERLPAGLRAVLVLKEIEGYSHREIGELLGISPGASAVRLQRAWKRLRKELDP